MAEMAIVFEIRRMKCQFFAVGPESEGALPNAVN
jgi:hypothetical protein